MLHGGSHLGEELRRRLLLNLLPRPLLILWVQLDLALVHCPSINGTNLEGETSKQNKQHVVSGITRVEQLQNPSYECIKQGPAKWALATSVAQDQVRLGSPEARSLTPGQTQVNGH